MEALVSYVHKDSPSGPRFMQLAGDDIPKWAIDIRPIEPEPEEKIKVVQLQIVCGETTCASEPGKFCTFLGSKRFGSIPVCMLFPSDTDSCTELEDTGWVQRCPACINATKE